MRLFEKMEYKIRPLTAADEPILWEMLYQALHDAPEQPAPPAEIVRRPEFARYVEGWGRPGDAGFVAFDRDGQQLLGAVWFRPPAEGATPELAFTVSSSHRKRGIGAALLTQWVRAHPKQSEVSLRVRAGHPAVRLYERFGFKVVNERAGSVTMSREA